MCVVVSSSFNVGGEVVWEGGSCVIFPLLQLYFVLALLLGERLPNDAILIGSTV